MNLENLEEALSIIANELNHENITWVLGGSMLLYYKGIVTEVHDLDIMIDEKDEEKVRNILLQHGTIIPIPASNKFISKVFMKFMINDVSIDIIGGFIISTDVQEYYFPLVSKDYETRVVHNATIYLDNLDTWTEYYRLMGRDSSYQKIMKYLK